ncbi:hypothetical protein [Hydrogenovibrio halophilus]|uniref:hypothetical protein n=1 Tax=Hydrogenovibrio halophilus TaxID=373391 RepID=UPI000365D625|nr:hypothetical protein [Hydrogenovibrio halophilus]
MADKTNQRNRLTRHLLVVGFCAALLYIAYMILIDGQIPTRFNNGYHSFDGIERILGLVPLTIGSGVLYLWLKNVIRTIRPG